MDPAAAVIAHPPVTADRCPGILRLHEAADGSLARVRLPGGRLTVRGLRAVAGVARRGNGVIELTARAGIQVRGLAAGDGAVIADELWAAGLLPSPLHDRVRNVLASPLAGRSPGAVAVTDAVVEALDRGLCADAALAVLPGRFLFAVDDGSGTLGAVRADVTLAAEAADRFRLWLSERPTSLRAEAGRAAALALDAAREFLTLRDREKSDAWRIANLDDGATRIARELGGRLEPAEARAGSGPPEAGVLTQADGRVAITVLPPLGRIDPAGAERLAELVGELGDGELRLSPARTLTLLDIPAAMAASCVAQLDALGLVTSPGSGWQGLSACAGLGACASAERDVRALATARAGVRGPDAPPEHWAACARDCGRPVGVEAGSR